MALLQCTMPNWCRPANSLPAYPPYHRGPYLEELFFQKYHQLDTKPEREYIDVFWTNIMCNATKLSQGYPRLQDALNHLLDPNGSYFTVCQHDDAPVESLPSDTVIYAAGGKRKLPNIVPIPLVCSEFPNIDCQQTKKHLASFVGSNTHEVRAELAERFGDNPTYHIELKKWTPEVDRFSFELHAETSQASRYILAPRGYGPTSFRLYEAIQLGAVPVYITDDFILPWADELNWNEFCVLVDIAEISTLDSTLNGISEVQYQAMVRAGREAYRTHFALPRVVDRLLFELSIN